MSSKYNLAIVTFIFGVLVGHYFHLDDQNNDGVVNFTTAGKNTPSEEITEYSVEDGSLEDNTFENNDYENNTSKT